MRIDGRQADEIREVKITRNFQKFAAGSVLIEMGDTKVICSASIENKVPQFLRNSGQGWITSEYSLLPGSTEERTKREVASGRLSGRTYEIQRLVGRSLRAIVDLSSIGEKTIWIDCDVLQADGGTRTASITGAWFALFDSLLTLKTNNEVLPVKDYLAAISVGIVDDNLLLDLNYHEDSRASVDMNLVMTGQSKFVEIQGTAEGVPYDQNQLQDLLELGKSGINNLIRIQQEYASEFFKNRLTNKGLG